MQPSRKTVLWALAGALFLAASVAIHHRVKVVMAGAGWAADGTLAALAVGDESPDFAGFDLDGLPVRMAALRKRKAVVLDFWAVWCAPCVQAMPDLQELHDEFKDRDVEILAVNLEEDPDYVREFIDRNRYTFRVVPDEDGSIGQAFGIVAIPTVVVVAPGGRIAYVSTGNSFGQKSELHDLLSDLARPESEGG